MGTSKTGTSALQFFPGKISMKSLREAARKCEGCPLFKNATQTVFGTGPLSASIVLVGEQPGHEEDLQGKPFVGPAGRLLDTALEEARVRTAAVAQRRAEYELASKQLADASVRAPFDGFITARPISVGQWVATNSKVATVMHIASMKLQLQIPEQQAAAIKTGMAVAARVSAYPSRDFIGKVSAVMSSVDSSSRAFIAEARFDNPKAELRPGMFANAKLMLQASERAVFVPSKSSTWVAMSVARST